MASHYSILAIDRNAGPEEIKKAYRTQAKKWHPDVNPSEQAEGHFREIHKAYAVLSNPVRRKAYDMGLDYLSSVLLSRKIRRDKEIKQNKNQNIALLLMFIAVVMAVVVSPLKTIWYKAYLGKYYSTTWCIFSSDEVYGTFETNYRYTYTVNGIDYTFRKEFSYNTLRRHYQTPSKFPVYPGMRFELRYNSLHPRRHYVNFKNPHPDGVDYLMMMCVAVHCTIKEEACLNQLRRLYERFGLKGLLMYYYQDVHPMNQLKYNRLKYRKMMEKLP